jgi:hypothetical protein
VKPAEPTEPAEPAKIAEPAEPLSGGSAAETGTPLGFPVPTPPPPYAVTEPGAVGGVSYRPFPDPRPADGADPDLGEAPTRPHSRTRFADRSRLALGAEQPVAAGPSAENVSAEDAAAPPEGRHTVPDALVQATTYRLPADRVFRARVPDGKRLPDEPTTHLPVPRPRQP